METKVLKIVIIYYMYISIVINLYINVKCDNSVKIEKSTLCVYNSHNFIDIKSIIKNNPILLNDDTLPTIDKNIKCINSECKKSPSIKYIKYDFENMKFMYICNHCGESWTNNI